MPSFDIVSKLKKDEVQNAVDNANRELQTRFDFRGVEASFTFDKSSNEVKLEAMEEFQIQQMDEILRMKLIKRNIEAGSASFGDITRSGKKSLQTVSFKEGIDKELGKKLCKMIKDAAPHILIVALGCPKQELFILHNRDKLGVPISLGLGASLDFEAGNIKRAPKWMANHGLEWLYRITQDPKKKKKRYLVDDMKIFRLAVKYKK